MLFEEIFLPLDFLKQLTIFSDLTREVPFSLGEYRFSADVSPPAEPASPEGTPWGSANVVILLTNEGFAIFKDTSSTVETVPLPLKGKACFPGGDAGGGRGNARVVRKCFQ